MFHLMLVSGFECQNFHPWSVTENIKISQNEQNLGLRKRIVFFLKTCMIAVNVAFVI